MEVQTFIFSVLKYNTTNKSAVKKFDLWWCYIIFLLKKNLLREKEATPTHLHLLSNSRAYKKLSSQTFSIQFRFDSIENHMKLFILICLLVNTHAFRVPLPYGNGIQSNGQEGIGINQGIFHQILSWFSTMEAVKGTYTIQ